MLLPPVLTVQKEEKVQSQHKHGLRNGIAQENSSAELLSREELLRQFRNPFCEYEPIDCWWWEAGHLSKKRLRWQLEEMKKKGIAGVWFYPRFFEREPLSSDPPYWTEEWWDFVKFSVEELRRLDMQAWVSDWTAYQYFQNRLREKRKGNPKLTGWRLRIHEKESKAPGPIQIKVPPGEEILSAAAYKKLESGLDGTSRRDLTDAIQDNKLVWNVPEADWLVTVVTSQSHDLDYLNRLVVSQWLKIFLQVYEQKLPSLVGNILTAYGPDEMHVLDGNILYSASLHKRFKAEKGYDPSPYFAGLFHDIGEITDKIRCDYYDVMASLLEDNLYEPMSQWCHKHGMSYVTIATWGRQDILGQTYHYGDFFRMMRWFDMPGNEDPGLTEVGERCFIDAKLSSSVAHLYQHRRVGGCFYWGSGWGVSQEQNLAWTNENYAYGINLYNRHGVLYSTLGGWYEWVPPAIHFRQPYWQYWKSFTDYIKRLSYMMSQGVHRADVAFLYPITTVHANWLADKGFSNIAEEAASMTLKLAQLIYRSGIDFDFIDYSSLCSAQVDNGRLKVSGLEFHCIVLPPMTTIRTETLQKIKEFYDSGGTVVAFRRLPNASAEKGRNDPNIRSMLKEIFDITSSDEFNVIPLVYGIIEKRIDVLKHENKQKGKAFFIPGDENLVPETISTAFFQDVVVSREHLYPPHNPVTLERDIFHTHQKVGDVDIYFLFNVKSKVRNLSFTFRVRGEPEIWDAFTGEARPVHRFEHQGETTKVHLEMGPYQGVVLVFVPSPSRVEVLEDNLATIERVEPGKERVGVQGFYDTAGKKKIHVRYKGKHYVSEIKLNAPPGPIVLEGLWDFYLEPTMDNRWGDFRYPASSEMIGAEARGFKYMEEGKQPGTELGWYEQRFDDSHWPEFTYSFGPYWHTIGPFEEGKEPKDFLEKAIIGEVDLDLSVESGGHSFRWNRYDFSKKYGYEGKEVHNKVEGSLCGVSKNFLVFDTSVSEGNSVRYLFTYVHSPEECDLVFNFGEKAEFPRQAWINGKQIVSTGQKVAKVLKSVHLKKGWNSVLLRMVHLKGQGICTFAVFQETLTEPTYDPYVPLLRWFSEPQKLILDIMPRKKNRLGWYRFAAPPGLWAIKLNLKGRGVQAWINGKPAAVREGKITLTTPLETVSQVALRVEQEPGCYAGAAFPEPISFECEQGKIPLGDWSDSALATYSGGAVYTKTVNLEKCHLKGKILLDLGQVSTVAEVHINGKLTGIRMGRPYRFDITELVQEGRNQIQVKVTNTLANHYAVGYPSKFVYHGQTISGLLGPVKIQFLSRIDLAAASVSWTN